MKKKRWIRILGMLLALTVALGATACSSGGGAGGSSQQQSSAQAESSQGESGTPTIRIVTDNFQPVDPDADGAVMKAIEEVTGYDMQVTWYPTADYATKVNTLLASGDLPEILMYTPIKAPTIVQSVRDGVFWEISDYLDDYPSLSKINSYQRESISIDGKDYAVPRDMDMAFYAPVYRSDWLKKLNLEPPTNIEELYEVFYAFTYNDPDGNGVDDTYGMVESQTFATSGNWMMTVIYYGGPNEWGIQDNKVTPVWEYDAFWKAMDFYRRAYSEGVMNRDFLTKTDQQGKEDIEIGKAGGSIAHVWQITERWPNFSKNFPDGDLDVAYLKDVNGEDRHYPSNGGVSGMYLMPKNSVPDETALAKCLDFLDKLADPKVQNIIQYGIEGVHYEVQEDGTAHIIDQGAYDDEVNVFRRIKPHTMLDVLSPSAIDSAAAKRDAFIKAEANNTVANPVLKYVSDTYVQKGTDLDTLIDDAIVQYIMGSIDKAAFDEVIQQWYSQGGQKICDEYTALWQAENG